MTLTLDLRPETLAALQADAQAQGRDVAEVAAQRLDALYHDEASLVALGQGFADLDAGRTLSLDEARADFRADFAVRYGSAQGA